MPRTDVLVVSVEGTGGWTVSARELVALLQRAGASVALARSGPVRRVRTFMLTDLVQARAARAAAVREIKRHEPEAVIYCSITASLLWPEPGAIWLDSIAAENRPGRHGIWQRALERRRLAQAPIVLAMSEGVARLARGHAGAVCVLPSPVEPSGEPHRGRDIAALTYTSGDAEKRRLEYVLEAWRRVRRGDETLVVAGAKSVRPEEGVNPVGRLESGEYRELLRRTRVFVAAPRREDYGIAPLEALADGCLLVSTHASGAYPALDIARRLDPRLIGDGLAGAIRTALDDPLPGYAERARELLRPFSRAVVAETIAQEVLPRLVSQRRP